MTTEDVLPHDELVARFFHQPESVTDEQLAQLARAHDSPWVDQLHQLIVAEQVRRKLGQEAESKSRESHVPLGDLLSLLNETPEELTDQQLGYLERSYPSWWISGVYERIVGEQERRRKAKEEEVFLHMDDIITRLVSAPATLSALDLDELERRYRPYPEWAHSRATQERERRKAATKEAVRMSDGGEAVGLVRIGDLCFAVIPEYNNDAMHAVLNLDRATVGHVFTVDGRSVCQTCQRADCVHAEAVKRLLKHAGGDHASV